MKLLKALVRPGKVDVIKDEFAKRGIPGITVAESDGTNRPRSGSGTGEPYTDTAMKPIKALVRPGKVDVIEDEFAKRGIPGITATESDGTNRPRSGAGPVNHTRIRQ